MAEPNLTTPRLFWVRAVYDFISTVSTDVSFREGDILAVTSGKRLTLRIGARKGMGISMT